MIPEEAAKFGIHDGATGVEPTLTQMGNEDVVPYLLGYIIGQAEVLADSPKSLSARIEQIMRAGRLVDWKPR